MHLFEAVFEAPLLTITEDHSTSAPASVPIWQSLQGSVQVFF
jgi:hypothetical protein